MERSLSMGVVVPHKMKTCNKCNKDILCDKFDELINQKKESSGILRKNNLRELKRQAPNEKGHILPKYKTI